MVNIPFFPNLSPTKYSVLGCWDTYVPTFCTLFNIFLSKRYVVRNNAILAMFDETHLQ